MLSSILVSYFIHQFQQPVQMPFRQDQTVEYIRTVEQRGALTVKTSSARAGSVPPGSQRIEMLRLQLQVSCADDVQLNTITVQRRGLGANTDIAALYAIHRGSRISIAREISRKDGLVDLNVRRLTLKACETEEIYIYADFASDAAVAGEHSIVLKGIDAGKATVRIDEQQGQFIRPKTTSGRPVGQLSVDYRSINERVSYGTRQRISRFTLSADNKDDHLVHAITFTNNGSASDEDLQNIFVEFRNRKVSTVASSLTGDRVRLTFTPPLEIAKNNTLLFSIRADIMASRSRTIQLLIEEPSDIEAEPDIGR